MRLNCFTGCFAQRLLIIGGLSALLAAGCTSTPSKDKTKQIEPPPPAHQETVTIEGVTRYYEDVIDGKNSEIADLKMQIAVVKSELDIQKAEVARLQQDITSLQSQIEVAALRERLKEAEAKLAEWDKKWNTVFPKKKSYTVKEGDTLESIAADPTVYGDRAKWTLLYEANKDKIPNKERPAPGTEIAIP